MDGGKVEKIRTFLEEDLNLNRVLDWDNHTLWADIQEQLMDALEMGKDVFITKLSILRDDIEELYWKGKLDELFALLEN